MMGNEILRVIAIVALACLAVFAFFLLLAVNWEQTVIAAVVVIACVVGIVKLVRAGRRPVTADPAN